MKRSKISIVWEHFVVTLMFSVLVLALLGSMVITYFDDWQSVQAVVEWVALAFLSILLQEQVAPFPTILDAFTYEVGGIFFVSFTTSLWVIWKFRIKDFDNSLYRHLDGPRLILRAKANKHFRWATKGMKRQGLFLHPAIRLPTIYETANFLIWGMQGAGKSNLIKYLSSQLMERDERIILYDMKGEYTELFFDDRSLLFNPQDARSIHWNLCLDIDTIGLAEAFAESVISNSATKETFWVDSARVVLVGVIAGLINEGNPWSWKELSTLLFANDVRLSSYLKIHYPPAASLINPDDKTTLSIRSMIATQLSWIKSLGELPIDPSKSFSISNWFCEANRKTLIVRGDITSPTMSQALLTAFLAVLSNYVLSQPDDEMSPTWIIIGELATINKSKSIESWLAQGRSKGCRTIAGIQLLSQLYSIYGKEDANTLLGLFGNVVTFRLAANGEAKTAASEAFGKRRIEYRTQSINSNGEISYSLQQENAPVVKPDEIVSLPLPSLKRGIAGYMQVSGIEAVYQMDWPIVRDLKKIAPSFIQRNETSDDVVVTAFNNKLNRRMTS